MKRLRRCIVVAAAIALSTPCRAYAQLPFPLEKPEAPKKPEKKATDHGRADDSVSESKPEKIYKKPEPRPLPEGEARKLEGPIAVVSFDAIVNPGMGEYTLASIERAEREGAQAVLIELDTPGGLVSTTEKIVQSLLGARIPIIVYVTPSGAHAASAGTFITLAGHVAAMAPATRLGAAHPVTGSGKDVESEGGTHMAKKVENDLIALVEGIAKERNRNVEWATDAVRESVSANADVALEIGVIDFVARDRAELFEKLEGHALVVAGKKVELHTKGASIIDYAPSIRARVLNLMASPGIAMLLGLLGLIGIMIEIYHPGGIIPGVMGVLCIICSLIAMEQLPIDIGAAILVAAGIVLMIVEIYTPTYGLLAVLGAAGLVVGLLLFIDTSDPDFSIDPSVSFGLVDVLPIAALMLGFIGYLSFFVVRQKRGPSMTGEEGLIGSRGHVLKAVGPDGGTVFVSGEYWKARSSESIAEQDPVEVVRVHGLELEVRKPGLEKK